jgi:hypothetical protein
VFGTYAFGTTYFGDVVVQTTPDDIPECGGMWGSATFGSPYFGQHIQCPEPAPPVPPGPPTPSRRPSVAGSEQRAQWFYTDDELRNRALLEEMRAEEADAEDIALLIGLWLNRKQ